MATDPDFIPEQSEEVDPDFTPFVPLAGPSGEVYEVEPSQVEGLVQKGFSIATPEQIRLDEVREKYSGPIQTPMAALDSMASVMSFGASPWIAKLGDMADEAMGIGDGTTYAERMQGRREANPNAALVGTVGGFVAGAAPRAVAWGLGKVGLKKAGEVAGTSLVRSPVAQVGTVGTAIAERLTPQAVTGLGKVGAKAFGYGAAGVAEGVAYGSGQALEQAALDPDYTAEQALATVGLSAALSGGFGAAFGGVAGGLGALVPKQVKGGLEALEKEEKVSNLRAKDGWIAKTLKKGATKLDTQVDPKVIEELFAHRDKLPSTRDLWSVTESYASKFNGVARRMDDLADELGKSDAKGLQAAIARYRKARTGLDEAGLTTEQAASGGTRRALDQDVLIDRLKDLNPKADLDGWAKLNKPLKEFTDASKSLHALAENAGALPKKMPDPADLSSELTALRTKARLWKLQQQLLPNESHAVSNAKNIGSLLKVAGAENLLGMLGFSPMVSVPIGVAWTAYDVFGSATRLARTLGMLEKYSKAAGKKIKAGAGHVVNGTGPARPALAPIGSSDEVRDEVIHDFGLFERQAKAEKPFEKRAETIRELRDPELMFAKLSDAIEGTDLAEDAPLTTEALHQTMARAVGFLSSKLPPETQGGPLALKVKPSTSQMLSFQRYYEAVENPFVVLKQAQQGTLTPEAIEAVSTVYPRLMDQIRIEVIAKLAESKDVIPYQRRLVLSKLLGQDLDGSQGIAQRTHQRIAMAQNEPPKGVSPKATPARADSLDMARRFGQYGDRVGDN